MIKLAFRGNARIKALTTNILSSFVTVALLGT
jgi:hypothetical protein